MNVKELVEKCEKNDSFIDAFMVYDDLESILGKPPPIETFKNVIKILEDEFKKKIINVNEVISIEYENEYLNYGEIKNSGFKNDRYNLNNIQLIKEYKKTKDINIRNKIIVNNLKLIAKYAYVYSRKSSLEYKDLVNEGVLGMIDAIENYDINRDNKFSTYVVYWIKQKIRRAIQDKGNIIRIPVHLQETIQKLNRLEDKYKRMELDVDVEKICEIAGIKKEIYYKLKKIQNTFLKTVSLYTLVGEEEETELIELINSEEDKSLEDIIIKRELKEIINETLSTLTPREEGIIRKRFGFDDGEPKTLEKIGQSYRVTRERIRQIEAKALRKLRHPSRLRKLKDYF